MNSIRFSWNISLVLKWPLKKRKIWYTTIDWCSVLLAFKGFCNSNSIWTHIWGKIFNFQGYEIYVKEIEWDFKPKNKMNFLSPLRAMSKFSKGVKLTFCGKEFNFAYLLWHMHLDKTYKMSHIFYWFCKIWSLKNSNPIKSQLKDVDLLAH